MPVRDKAEVTVMPMFAGPLRWTMGHVMGADSLNEDEFWEVGDFVTELYVATMEAIDWNRLVLEAGAMCSHKQEADPDHKPKVRGIYEDTHGEENMNMNMTFCADCLRLVALRLQKHEIMEQDDVEGTLPEEHPPKGWKLPPPLIREFAEWLKRRKAAFVKAGESS